MSDDDVTWDATRNRTESKDWPWRTAFGNIWEQRGGRKFCSRQGMGAIEPDPSVEVRTETLGIIGGLWFLAVHSNHSNLSQNLSVVMSIWANGPGIPDPLQEWPRCQGFAAWPWQPPPGWRRSCCCAFALQPLGVSAPSPGAVASPDVRIHPIFHWASSWGRLGSVGFFWESWTSWAITSPISCVWSNLSSGNSSTNSRKAVLLMAKVNILRGSWLAGTASTSICAYLIQHDSAW